MEAFTGLPLDDDIINRVLTLLPDFCSLKATILATKVFYDVYKAHPNSIRRAVAENVVGPALPQALRAIRYCVPDEGEDSETEGGGAPEGETDESAPITNEEVSELVEKARMFRGLEDVFSLRHKNRKFKKSQLTYDESLRFQRAIYRLALFTKVFYGPELTEAILESDEDVEAQEFQAKKRAEQIKFLHHFSVLDLRQLYSASVFLTELVRWAAIGYFDQPGIANDTMMGVSLSCGPDSIYQCYLERSMEEIIVVLELSSSQTLHSPFFASYLTYPLSKLFEEHDFKGAFEDITHWRSILDDVVGIHDPCSRCGQEGGFDLWGASTYEYLYRITKYLRPQTWFRPGTGWITLLKGELSKNRLDKPYFERLIKSIPEEESVYEHVVQDLLNSDYKAPEYEDWSSDDWLCTECLTKLLKDNLHLWLLDKKIQAGDDIPADCWYGWNCRTQTHNIEHAKKLNHICEPTKGK